MSTRVLVPLAAAVLALTAGGSLSSEGRATTPGANGLIVYNEMVGDDNALFTIRPDGTEKRRIVYVKGSDAEYPDWSPDGRKIVFQLDSRDDLRGCRVALVNADGTGLTNLSRGIHGCDGQPAFTADGRRIVFGRFDDKIGAECLWSMNPRGRDRRPITPCKGHGPTDPNVSPDGKWVTYVHIKNEERRLLALYAVRPNGAERRRLVRAAWSIGTKHDWSPDGKLIVLTRNAQETPGKSANVVTIHPDGSGASQLTHYAGGSTNAYAGSFSPDGQHIVFRLEKDGQYALAVIDRDGSNLQLLTEFGPDRPRNIDWGTHP
jgi:Tol biopolymer transport system component